MPSSVNNDPPPVTQADIEEHNIQALIELVYVREANNLLQDSLGSLYQAIGVTSDALKTLTAVQNLHNLIDAQSKSAFKFNYSQGGDPSDYSDNYNEAASAYFGTPIDPFFIYSSNDPRFDDMQKQLKSAKAHIKSIISALSILTPGGENGQEDPTSLLAALRKVYNDLDSYNLNDYDDVKKWVLDNYDQHSSTASSKAGLIQQNITLAITASENLNNSQTESVRSYLFVFEEYYKSAAGLLTKISQLIEKMAQGISR